MAMKVTALSKSTIKEFQPTDATTNPSLILAAAKNDNYKSLITEAITYAKKQAAGKPRGEVRALALDKLFVLFGKAILQIIPGRVSTEVDARLSFDTQASIQKGLALIKLYEEEGISKDRILIKLASTWEGVQAARELESKHGVHCNMTLLFNYHQAIACAQANVTLVSPFVGRIFDWYCKNTGTNNYDRQTDPGVKSVVNVYNYYKKFGHHTQVMAASFRNTEEIKDLLVSCLAQRAGQRKRDCHTCSHQGKCPKDTVGGGEGGRKRDAMSTEKLAEGIRKFAADARVLEKLVDDLL
uniref:Transaldolase n=1 Tax=Ditylenchus dipsaci TaxID=166011 RepID=A0A915D9S6_9BILA